MNRIDIHKTKIKDLLILQRNQIEDDRGYLERMYCSNELKLILNKKNITQVNHTLTKEIGSIRGMHLQCSPHSEMKLVSCIKGEILDVAVDLRKKSSTFLQWHAELLTEKNHKTLIVPEGFAHGFQSLTADCEILYFVTAPYASESERGINPLDPAVGIEWPINITNISKKDRALAFIDKETYKGVEY